MNTLAGFDGLLIGLLCALIYGARKKLPLRPTLDALAPGLAAFMVALSMSIGLSTMIGSFRRSVERWLERQIPGDLYISSMDEMYVPVAFYDELRAMKELEGVDPYRNTQI